MILGQESTELPDICKVFGSEESIQLVQSASRGTDNYAWRRRRKEQTSDRRLTGNQ